jgi:hypothetical protein
MNGNGSHRDRSIRFGGLLGHLETTLGYCQGAWTKGTDGQELPFHIAHWHHQPCHSAVTCSTLGLFRHEVTLPQRQTTLQQELMLSVYGLEHQSLLASWLYHCGQLFLGQSQALSLHQVIGAFDTMLGDSDKCAFFVAPPVYFPPELAVWQDSVPYTHLLWLVPVTREEGLFIAKQGGSAFEALLAEDEPDILNLNRPSLVTKSR